jgi:2,4-dichlorophenol 6-monooxygenase
VWLEADLTRYTAHRPGILYFMHQPGNYSPVGSGLFVCVRPWTEWNMLMYYPAGGESALSEPAVTARIASLIGDDTVGIRIKSVSRWQINHLIARDYRRGRIFLAGDAAHRHPPGNGLGSNTAVQDAYNLAWKLSHVLRGQAGDALLDSYHSERQPVGRQVIDRALKTTMDAPAVPEAFGFQPGQSADDGWRSIEELFGDGEAGRRRRDALQAVLDLQNYQLNAHGVELGQRYQSAAIVRDGTPFPGHTRDPELYYQPTTHPGAHLPHVWLEHRGQRVSTLDLAGRGRFTVLTGIGGGAWLDAAGKITAELGVEIVGRQAGRGCDYDDVLGEWTRARETGDHGCLLVRPDNHIAWRSTDLPADPAAALRQALTQILAR